MNGRIGVRSLAALYLFAFLVRAAFLLLVLSQETPDAYMRNDSKQYVAIAEQLPEGLFSPRTIDEFRYNGLIRSPGYPLFLAAFVRADAVPGALWLQAALTALIPVGTAMLAAYGAPRRWALAAGVAAALSPTGIPAASLVMADGLFALVFLAGLTATARGVRDGSAWLIAGAAGFAAACYLKPGGVFWAFALPVSAYAWSRASRTTFDRRRTAIALATMAALVGLWSARNFVIEGTPMFSTNGGKTIVDYFATRVEAEAAGLDDAGYRALRAAHRGARQSLAPNERIAAERRRVTELLLKHPFLAVRVYFDNVFENAVAPWAAYEQQTGRDPRVLEGIDASFHAVLLAAALAGLLRAGVEARADRARLPKLWWAAGLALVPLYFGGVSGVTFFGGSRIFYPAEPALLALAAMLGGDDRPGPSFRRRP